jgi:hypothetical protein
LVEKWTPYDLFWTFRFFGFGNTMTLKGNEKYYPKEIK